MTLIDAFAGTDLTDLASHTPDGGGSWAEHSSYSAGSFVLASNRAMPGSSESLYYHSAAIDRTFTISAKVRVISTDQGYGGVAACVTAANTLYVVYLYAPTGQWAIGKYVAGSWTALGTWNDSVSVGTERTVDLVLSSSQVVFKVDGTVRGTFSDTSVTPTRAAVYGGGGSSTQGVHVDDFTTSNVVAASGSDSATGSDSSSGIAVSVPKAGTDSATGSDSSSLNAHTVTAPPKGTVTVTGPNLYGEDLFTYADAGWPLDKATSCTPQRRIAGSGGTWNDCSAVTTVTNLGGGSWSFRVRRTTYGTGGQPLGTTFEYRVVPANAVGTGTASDPVSSSPTFTTPATIVDRDMDRLAAAFVASGVGYLDSTVAQGRQYPGEVLLQMAWGFRRNTGRTDFRTHALNQLAYIQGLKDANGIIHFPGYTSATYIDHHGRTAYHIAAAARLFDLSGDPTTAQTFWTEANALAKAMLTQLGGGTPEYTTTIGSYLPDSQKQWPANTLVTAGEIYRPATPNGHAYRVMGSVGQTFTTGASAPTWPTGTGSTVTKDGITYRETGATGVTLKRDFSATSPYTFTGATGAAGYDLNQQTEVVALLTLLCESDKSADFYPAGSLRTRALDIIAGTIALATTYQGFDYDQNVHGGVAIGYDSSFASSYREFDTLYGSFTLETLAVVLKRSGADQHPAHSLFIEAGYRWLDSFHNEPITAARWAYGAQSTEFWFAAACTHVAAVLSNQATSRIEPLLWQACFWYTPAQDSTTTAFAFEDFYTANGYTAASSPSYPNRASMEPLAILDAANIALTLDKTGSDTATGSDSSSGIAVSYRPTGSDTGTGSDSSSLSVPLGVVTKSVSDTATGSDSSSRTIIRYLTATDTGTGTDSSGSSTTVPNVTYVATPTSLYSVQFSNSALSSSQFGNSVLVFGSQHAVSTTTT